MAGLDQRLTVFEDGRVQLDDRKARGRSEILASAGEIEGVRAALDAIPAERWTGRVALALRALLPRHHESMRIELGRGSRWIVGHAGSADSDLSGLLACLDELLARAVRERRG